MTLSLPQAIAKVNQIFAAYAASTTGASSAIGSPPGAGSLVGAHWKAGKIYEAWILSVILENLRTIEGFTVTLVGGTQVHLKSSGGPINSTYPRFVATRPGTPTLEIWTDIEFSTLSFGVAKGAGTTSGDPGKPHKHELDIVIVKAGTSGYPAFDEIIVAVECKNTGFEKSMARAALGVRRELSLLTSVGVATHFTAWPRSEVPADTASILLVYSTDPDVVIYNEAGALFGVDFVHEPMP